MKYKHISIFWWFQKIVNKFRSLFIFSLQYTNTNMFSKWWFWCIFEEWKKSGFVFGTLKMNVNIPNECKKKTPQARRCFDSIWNPNCYSTIIIYCMSKIYVLSKLHGTKYYLLIFNSFNVEPCNLKWIQFS